MCDVMDRSEKIGGDRREAAERDRVARDLIRKGNFSAEFISDISKSPVKTVKKLAKEMGCVLDSPERNNRLQMVESVPIHKVNVI